VLGAKHGLGSSELQNKAGVRMEKSLSFIGAERKSQKNVHLDRGQETKWEIPHKHSNKRKIMKLTKKLTSRVRTLALLPMLGLCLVLTGCEELTNSIVKASLPQGMMLVSGSVTAVNAADRTVEIKTGQGETLLISVTDTTKLTKAVEWLGGLGPVQYKDIKIGDIQVGKYMEITCSKEPVDGKHAASDGMLYNSKAAAEMD
jgi:hypothetical protein